jgi:hypothetical protein
VNEKIAGRVSPVVNQVVFEESKTIPQEQLEKSVEIPLQRIEESTSKDEFATTMQNPDAPRSLRASTLADSQRSKAGNLPSYQRYTNPQGYAKWQKQSAEREQVPIVVETIKQSDPSSEEQGEESVPKESAQNKPEGSSEEVSTLGSALNMTANSTEEVSSLSTLVDEKKESKDELSELSVTEGEQLVFMTAESFKLTGHDMTVTVAGRGTGQQNVDRERQRRSSKVRRLWSNLEDQ